MYQHHTGWNPDAVAPPCGDVYEREAAAGRMIGRIAKYAFLLALASLAYFLMHA